MACEQQVGIALLYLDFMTQYVSNFLLVCPSSVTSRNDKTDLNSLQLNGNKRPSLINASYLLNPPPPPIEPLKFSRRPGHLLDYLRYTSTFNLSEEPLIMLLPTFFLHFDVVSYVPSQHLASKGKSLY